MHRRKGILPLLVPNFYIAMLTQAGRLAENGNQVPFYSIVYAFKKLQFLH
jgi:hypothetical protein